MVGRRKTETPKEKYMKDGARKEDVKKKETGDANIGGEK